MSVTEAIWPLWIIGALAGGLIALLWGLMSSPSKNTRKIVVLSSSTHQIDAMQECIQTYLEKRLTSVVKFSRKSLK